MAYTINTVVLVGGNLTRDAELRYTNSGSALLSFSIAMNRRYKQGETWEEKTDFFKIVYWGKPAEAIGKFLTKGKKVAVEGRLSQNRWQSPDGKNMSSVEVIATNVVLMGAPRGGDAEQDGAAYEDYSPHPGPDQETQQFHDQGGYDGYQQPQGGFTPQQGGYQQGGYQQSHFQPPPPQQPQYPANPPRQDGGQQGYGGGYDKPDPSGDIPF